MLCYRCGSHVPDGSSTCGTCGQTFTVRGRKPTGSPKPRRRSQPSVPDAYQPGTKIADRFEVKSAVGQGPVGVVYRAIDREVDVEVAVKVITAKLIQSEEEKEQFRREARLIRSLSHLNCIRQYEEGFDNERAYLVMQYLEGLSLRKIIDLRHGKGQRFELNEVEPIFQQLCSALEHAHGIKVGRITGIAHGHLKPQNVIVLPDLLKVVDFREAAFIPRVPYIAAQRVRGGEVAYLAPEVVDGGKMTPAADLYGLGVLLGEMLTGQVATASQSLDLTSVKGVPRGMEGVYRRLIAPRPEDRYRNVAEAMEDISAVVAGQVPPNAATRRPFVSPPRAPEKPRVEVLDSGEFELVEAEEIQLDDGDLEEIDREPPTTSGRVLEDRKGSGSRKRESFGLDSAARPPPPPVDAMDTDDEQPIDPELAAELFDDIGTDGGSIPRREEDPPDATAGDRGDGPTVISRRHQTGRVARPIAEPTSSFREQPTVRRKVPQRPQPKLATGPGWELPTGLYEESALPDREAHRSARQKDGAKKGWERFAAVVVFSAAAGLVALLVFSEDIRAAFGLEGIFEGSAGDVVQPLDPGGQDPEGAKADPGTPDTTGLVPLALPPPEDPLPTKAVPVEPVVPPVEDTKVTRPPPRDPGVNRPVQSQPDPRPPRNPVTKATGGAGGEGRKVAAVTPQPGGDDTAGGQCPEGMAFIPAGRFMLGSAINDPMRNFAEHNLAEVQTGAYCIDRYEYGGRGRQPVVGVTWYRAKELCEARGRRLCTEEEWERACKGPRSLRFPYGNTFDPSSCNTEDADGNPREVAAGGEFSRCRSGHGVFDMAGNVAEWTASQFQAGLQDRTHKGGAANHPDWDTRCATRGNRPPNSRDAFLGFRCCVDPN